MTPARFIMSESDHSKEPAMFNQLFLIEVARRTHQENLAKAERHYRLFRRPMAAEPVQPCAVVMPVVANPAKLARHDQCAYRVA
jgi:hypothetical protein